MRVKAAILACGVLALGCSVESGGNGGPRNQVADAGDIGTPSAPEDRAWKLSVDGESNIVPLGLGETTELVVSLVNGNDEPQEDRRVTFELVGRPEDASLSSLTVETDSEGKGRVTLRAATRAVTFQVRASTSRAPSVSFSVSVSGSGFGTLLVHAPYEGVRAVDERFLLALPNVTCGAEEYAAGDPKTVLAPGEDSALLIALPADVPYAIIAIAESAGDETVARACTDAIVVPKQGELEVMLSFMDEPLAPEPQLALEMKLEAGSAAASLGAAIRSGVGERVRASAASARDAEGHFWLDALDASLRDGTTAQEALADALAAARLEPAGSTPEDDFTVLLGLNDEGAGRAASLIAAEVRTSLDTIFLRASLEVEGGEKPPIAIESLHVEALALVKDGALPSVVLDEAKASASAVIRPLDDTFDLLAFELAPGLGALGASAIDELIKVDPEELGVDLIATAGCDTLHEWYADQPYMNQSVCDDTCLDRACDLAFERIIEAADDALYAVDEERPLATLSGSFAMTDEDGDLLAETMEAERVDGSWAPAPNASLGDTLRGMASATVP